MNPLKVIFGGLLTVLKHAFRERESLCYPEKKQELPKNFRGSIALKEGRCIGCGLCQRLCPSKGVIAFKNKRVVLLDLSYCANCGNCAYNCPVNAIYITKRYEFATEDKMDLLLELEK